MSRFSPDPHFCIVALPDQPVADLCVLDAADDAAALLRAAAFAHAWPDGAWAEVFRGERRVGVAQGNGARAAA